MTDPISDAAREIGDRVETFVRQEIAPYEHDPRAGSHGPTEELVREMRDKAIKAGVMTPHIRKDGGHYSQLETAYILKKSQEVYYKGQMRLGTLMLGDEGRDEFGVMDTLKREGYQIFDDGLIAKDNEPPHPLYWFGEVPKPEDCVLKKSRLTLSDLYSESGQIKAGAPSYAGMSVQ